MATLSSLTMISCDLHLWPQCSPCHAFAPSTTCTNLHQIASRFHNLVVTNNVLIIRWHYHVKDIAGAVNSPSGSTLQCDTWLWDDMNSPKRPPYWNSTSGFHFHISPQSTCHSVPVCEILSKSDHPRQKKMTSCRFSRWRISAILDCRDSIMGSLKSPVKLT